MLLFYDSIVLEGRRQRSDVAVVPAELLVLVLPCEGGALEAERPGDHLLHVVRHLHRVPPALARLLLPQRLQEGHLVRRPRVHEEEVGVHELESPHRCRVEHAQPRVDRHRHDPVAQLSEQRAEPQQERLSAGGALGADDEVALLEESCDAGCVDGAVAGEGDGGDGG